jgi:hypothetical protein
MPGVLSQPAFPDWLLAILSLAMSFDIHASTRIYSFPGPYPVSHTYLPYRQVSNLPTSNESLMAALPFGTPRGTELV